MQIKEIETFLTRTTLRQVEVMTVLSRHNSMTGAAKELGITVAAVSRMSKRFESNLGISLFEGTLKRSVLLEQGREVIALLEPLLGEIAVLKTRLREVGGS